MMGINVDLFHWFINSLIKGLLLCLHRGLSYASECAGSGVKNEIMTNQNLEKESLEIWKTKIMLIF